MYIPIDERAVTDLDLFNSLDYSSPGLEPVKKSLDEKNYDDAKRLLINYFEKRDNINYYFDYRSKDIEKIDTDTNPYLFQAGLGLSGSLKKFCLDSADKMMDNIYVLPGGDKEEFLGKNYESMIHFNHLEDQGKRHRSSLDMFVRGQFFEYLAVAYHERKDRKYLEKIEELFGKFFEVYPLVLEDTSKDANRFMFTEDRDVMSLGWLTLTYSNLFYTRVMYDMPYQLAFEVLKRIWFQSIQFRRFDDDYYRSYNHHYFERGVVPYILSILYPEFPAIREMKEKGKENIRRHLDEDINQDGGYSEHSIAYFSGAMLGEMSVRALSIAKLNNEELLDAKLHAKVNSAFSLLATIAPETSNFPAIGDNRGPQIDTILALGVTTLDNTPCKEHLKARNDEKYTPDLPLDYANDKTGFAVSRSSYKKDQNYMIMSAKVNAGGTGHNHMDLLSLCLTINGVKIVDETYAGKLYHTIRMGSELRGYMYNMTSHNTVLCYSKPIQDNMMYANKWGVFRPDTPIEETISENDYFYIRGYHTAYTHAKHTREVAFLRDKGFLVQDTLLRGNRMKEKHSALWHLAEGLDIERINESTFIAQNDKAKVLIAFSTDDVLLTVDEILSPEIVAKKEDLAPLLIARFINDGKNPDALKVSTKALFWDVSEDDEKSIKVLIEKIPSVLDGTATLDKTTLIDSLYRLKDATK